MSIQSEIDLILKEQKSYRPNPLMQVRAQAVKNLTNIVRAWLVEKNLDGTYRVQGSNGQGNNAKVPWVTISNPKQSPDTKNGWYLVFLFAADGSTSYISLNFGVTKLKPSEIDDQS
jgi:hypothetical protein